MQSAGLRVVRSPDYYIRSPPGNSLAFINFAYETASLFFLDSGTKVLTHDVSDFAKFGFFMDWLMSHECCFYLKDSNGKVLYYIQRLSVSNFAL